MDVNLRRLRAFVVVAEELHFTRAAKRLYVAQQALSKQIAELETMLGTSLFDRTTRKVELTPAGEVLLAAVREALLRIDEGVEEARRVGRGEHATLRVGFIAGAALELTSPILGEFTNRYPETSVELHEYGLADPSAGLASGATDVAFIRLPSATQDLVTLRLFTEPSVAGVSTANPLSRRESLRVADLLDLPLAIGHTDDTVWRDFWTLAAHRAPGSSARLVETASQGEEMEVVAAGMACNITPAAARRYAPHPGVRFIPIEDSTASAVALAYRNHTENPLVHAFRDAAATVIEREIELVRAIEHDDFA
ncbi:LysR family transcriptional regulator [Nocardioides sp. NPDC126508]